MATFSKDHVEPVVLTGGRQKEHTVIYFTGAFTPTNIRDLINDIELARQSTNFNRVDIYFQSPGGSWLEMNALVDYLNDIHDFKINICVTGYACSAGFWTLAMLDNRNIQILYMESAIGLIHLADIKTSVRSEYDDNENWDKFAKKHCDELNKEKFIPMLDHMGLTKAQINKVKKGQDLYLTKDELKKAIETYHEWRYCTSEDGLKDYYIRIESEEKRLSDIKADLRDRYKKATGEDFLELEHIKKGAKKK